MYWHRAHVAPLAPQAFTSSVPDRQTSFSQQPAQQTPLRQVPPAQSASVVQLDLQAALSQV
jgi:hypothetical protein